MECVDEREQARFIKWTHRPEVRELTPSLCWMFYWIGEVDRNAARDRGCAFNDNAHVPALLILPDENGDAGLALKFKSTTGTTSESQDEWLAHVKAEDWLVLAVRSADEARAAVMHYLDADLPPL